MLAKIVYEEENFTLFLNQMKGDSCYSIQIFLMQFVQKIENVFFRKKSGKPVQFFEKNFPI